MKRKIDDRGFMNPWMIVLVVIILILASLAVIIVATGASGDDMNPMSKRMYLDVNIKVGADLDSPGTFVIDKVSTNTETKRLQLDGLRWTTEPTLYITLEDQNGSEIDSINREKTFNFDNSFDSDSTGPHTLGPIEEGTNEVTLTITFLVYETGEEAAYYKDKIDLRGAW